MQGFAKILLPTADAQVARVHGLLVELDYCPGEYVMTEKGRDALMGYLTDEADRRR